MTSFISRRAARVLLRRQGRPGPALRRPRPGPARAPLLVHPRRRRGTGGDRRCRRRRGSWPRRPACVIEPPALGEPVWHESTEFPYRRPLVPAGAGASSCSGWRAWEVDTAGFNAVERASIDEPPLVAGWRSWRRRPSGTTRPGCPTCWRASTEVRADADPAADRRPPGGRPLRAGARPAAPRLPACRRRRRGRPRRLRRSAGRRGRDPARGAARRDRRSWPTRSCSPRRPGSGSTTQVRRTGPGVRGGGDPAPRRSTAAGCTCAT